MLLHRALTAPAAQLLSRSWLAALQHAVTASADSAAAAVCVPDYIPTPAATLSPTHSPASAQNTMGCSLQPAAHRPLAFTTLRTFTTTTSLSCSRSEIGKAPHSHGHNAHHSHHHGSKAAAASDTSDQKGDQEAADGTPQHPKVVLHSELHVTVEPLGEPFEGVSVLSLTRGEARNAIGRRMLRELAEALDILRQERTTRCVVLRSGVQGTFSAGADLKERAGMTQAETLEFVGQLRRTFSEVQGLPMPTIAAIEGAALGGGAELALAADIRVAGSSAVFAFPEAQLGIIPGAGGTQRLPRLVGASKAKQLIFTGQRVPAREAVEMGLVDEVVQEGQAYERALAIAAQIARSAPLSLRMAKSAINHGLEVDISTGLRMEEAYYAQLVPTKDRLEGLRAFAEKRSPEYKGE